jgi:tetratricopeptide (TPR) repeat protein
MKLLKFFLLSLTLSFFVKAVEFEVNPLYLNEGLTSNQVTNIRIYSVRAENLVLDAYSALSRRTVYYRETKSYLNGALFFLNEAKQYSPTYLVKRQIEAIQKRIKLFPEEDYTDDLKNLYIYIEEISGNLNNYAEIKSLLLKIIENAKMRKNALVSEKLDILDGKIKIKLIDSPINEAQNLISIAIDHLKAGRYTKSKKALELALNPLISLSSKENLFVALAREYIYKAYLTYDYDQIISLKYVDSALIAINKAYYVSSQENKDTIRTVREKIRALPGIFDNKQEAQKLFTDIIGLLQSI